MSGVQDVPDVVGWVTRIASGQAADEAAVVEHFAPRVRVMLRARADRRGLAIDDAALDWLLERVGRDLAGLTARLDALDRLSLAAQRRITVPFLWQALDKETPAAG